jgi:GT2 family glycosyltransferase
VKERVAAGIVAIGRNEGSTLGVCLASLRGSRLPIVYVDSGSTDGSVEIAKSHGATVVDLDRGEPFTVARARNAGMDLLVGEHPGVEYVQFVDADCFVMPGWLERAQEELRRWPDVAAVGGRRRERFPGASIYNKLFDMEWERPVGECDSCGGDVMVRVAAFREIGGYDARLIGGTDPEFSLRLRRKGWRILQVDAEMTLHDAATYRFGQWWRRTVRSGYAYGQAAALNGRGPERFGVRPVVSALIWGLVLPALAAATLLLSPWRHPLAWVAAALAAVYGLQLFRIHRYRSRLGDARRDALFFAAFCLMGKMPEATGVLRFLGDRIRGRRARLIEYRIAKSP